MAFIPAELIAYCLLAGGLYLALVDFLQIWLERVFSKMGLWENYPKSLIRPAHTGGRIWNFITQLFLFVAIPTLLVWRFGPKPVKPGHCRCGYDLTGNTSGVCPECGTKADIQ